VPAVRTGPVIGLIGQLAVLAVLDGAAGAAGIGAAGWAAGVAWGLAVCAGLTVGLRGSPSGRLGPADWVTLLRATLVGGVAALTAASVRHPVPVPLLAGLATTALVLDGVDGLVARRTGTASALGARFDMEVDAFLILVLSVSAARAFGGWPLAIGAMRYAFWAAARPVPWLGRRLPPRYWRKVVASTQGVVLVFAYAGVLPRPVTTAALLGALALLVESFGRDVWWLARTAAGARLPSPPAWDSSAAHDHG
jgi:phosphatidylglycerophosphate synthase